MKINNILLLVLFFLFTIQLSYSQSRGTNALGLISVNGYAATIIGNQVDMISSWEDGLDEGGVTIVIHAMSIDTVNVPGGGFEWNLTGWDVALETYTTLALVEDNDTLYERLVNGTGDGCTCTSTECGGPTECVAKTVGGCACTHCFGTCTKVSTAKSGGYIDY